MYDLLPLTRGEIMRFDRHPQSLEEALLAGAYPPIFDRDLNPSDWLRSYVATYIDRDVRTISNVRNLATFQRFIELCVGRTAQLLNYSSLAGDCGISQPRAKAWLGILEASFIVFRLPAFHSNLRKRLVKMPKLHFYDTGLVCWFLGIRTPEQLRSHPLRGSIFETWVVSETAKHRANLGETRGLSFYRDKNGAEADLVIEHPSRVTLVEAKSTETASSNLFDGVRRVRRHFTESDRPCSVVVAYGGDQVRQHVDESLIPWCRLREVSLGESAFIVSVFADGRPIAGARVLALFPNKTWKAGLTDKSGEAVLDLHSAHLPMTVFVAVTGFEAHLERDWIPSERMLNVDLSRLPDGGAVILENGTGEISILQGRLNPILDDLGRTYLYAENVAINGGKLQQPFHFKLGSELRLTDAEGRDVLVRVISIVGRSALVQYRPV